MEALRTLAGTVRRRPLKLLYFVISLGVSFGFIAAVVAIAHASWFRLPPGVAERAYVTALRQTTAGIQVMSVRDFEAIEALAPEIDWFYVQGFVFGSVEAVLTSGAAQIYSPHVVSAGFFAELGVEPVLGSLSPPNSGPAVVLSDRAWSRLFGRADIVGENLRVTDGPSLPIVGVAAPGFVGVLGREPEAWIMNAPTELTLPAYGIEMDPRTQRQIAAAMATVTLFGAPTDDRDPKAVFADVGDRLAAFRFNSRPILVEIPGNGPSGGEDGAPKRRLFAFGIGDTDRITLGAGLEPSPDKRREVVRRTIWLLGIVAMLLLMAFVSALEFLMAENIVREDEQNVRIAVGAAPMDLFRQALVENLIVAAAMGLLAWLTAAYVIDVLTAVEPFSGYLRELPVTAMPTGFAIAGLLLASAFLMSMGYVSWFVARSSVALARSGHWLRQTTRRFLLVVATASLVAVLSLSGRYLGEARLSLGFQNTDVAFVTLSDPGHDFTVGLDLSSAAPFVEAIEAIPGVRSAATLSIEPLTPAGDLHSFIGEVVGRPDLADTPFFRNAVTPGFFRTLGVDVLAGRIFESRDFAEVVVSRSAAELLGGIEAVLGSPLRFKSQMSGESEATVVGVVGEVLYGGDVDGTPLVYSPIPFVGRYYQRWLIDAERSLDVIDALGQLPQFAGWEIELGDSPATTFRKQFLARRSVEIVLSIAAAFALALALAGVGNSLARTVAEARVQIGIRFALGATPAELARSWFGASILDLALAGVVVGGAGLIAKAAAPQFTEALDLWLVLPALLGLTAACGLMIHVLIGQLTRRQSVNELVHGAVAQRMRAGT